MDNSTVLVLSGPAERELAMLDALPPETGIAVGENAEAFVRAAADASVILNWSGSGALLREVFLMCPRLRWVHCRSAGLENLVFPELVASPVILTNGTGVFSASLGEFALAAILFFAKDFRRLIRQQEKGVWDPFDATEVAGRTVGIAGYGDIGRAVAARVHAMGMRVLGLRRRAAGVDGPDPLASRIYGPEGLHEMIAASHYLVITAPLTAETRGMIGAPEFAAMRPDAVVINIGRGPVIDESAMIEALRGRRILGAALDVFDREPLPAGHPFYRMENVLLSPHSADHVELWTTRAMEFFLAQFERFRKGEPLQNVVRKELGY